MIDPSRITSENIRKLEPDQVFVFGSNYRGIHGKGAAKLALQKFGAVRGQGIGMMGRSYGIATKDDPYGPGLPLSEIEVQVTRLLKFASMFPDLHFLVTVVGCGLAGHSVEDIGPMFFRQKTPLPLNVSLPQRFWDQKPKS